MISLLGYDFKYQLYVDYASSNSCEASGCIEEGICRCTEIHDCQVTDVKFKDISDIVYNSYFDKSKSSKRNIKINELLYGINEEIDRYTVDRILRINKIWLDKNWIVQINNGYYGQEIDVVILTSEMADKISKELDTAFDILDLNKRVEFLLELEYGKLLPQLENCSWKLIKLKKDDIIFPSKSHLELVGKKELIHYSAPKYNSIRAVVTKDGNYWKLVDGYHRLSAISLGDFWVLAGEKS